MSEPLKTGMRPVQHSTRSYKPGEVLFEEGTFGKELFIIQEGKVGVYKNTPDGKVELAVIEKGGTIGEMSLLDNMQRSATVTAIEPTKALIINQATFQSTIQDMPIWLSSIIKIIVNRLRDANKRVDMSILRDKEHGLVSLMLLLLPVYKKEIAMRIGLEYDLLMIEAYYVCRLKKKEIQRHLEVLEKRGIVEVVDNKASGNYVVIRDLEVLRLFEEFLALKAQKKKFREIDVPDEAIAVLSNIAYVAQKSGRETEDGTSLPKSVLAEDLEDKSPEKLEKNLLDLRRRNLINILPTGENDAMIIFRKEELSRIKKIKEWIPKFEMEPA